MPIAMLTVSTEALVDVIAVGAAAIALWLYVRVRTFAPRGLRDTLLHLGAAFILLSAVPTLMVAVVGASESPGRKLAALFLLVFPSLVYAFLSIVWFLKVVQSMLRLR